MAKRDDTLRGYIETGRKNAQYTSRGIHSEVTDVVAEYIRKENTRSLEDENALFSITDPHGNQEIGNQEIEEEYIVLYKYATRLATLLGTYISAPGTPRSSRQKQRANAPPPPTPAHPNGELPAQSGNPVLRPPVCRIPQSM